MRRRTFVTTCAGVLGALAAGPSKALASSWRRIGLDPHPTPRPGITAAKVTSAEILAKRPLVADAFEAVRAIPEVVDGLRCHCGCAGLPGYYSLLSCFEGPGAMALSCPICPGEGRMAARLHKAGKSLTEIRAALDAKYG
jgi:hypothetical protein